MPQLWWRHVCLLSLANRTSPHALPCLAALLAQECGPLREDTLALVALEVLKFVKSCHDLHIVYGEVLAVVVFVTIVWGTTGAHTTPVPNGSLALRPCVWAGKAFYHHSYHVTATILQWNLHCDAD